MEHSGDTGTLELRDGQGFNSSSEHTELLPTSISALVSSNGLSPAYQPWANDAFSRQELPDELKVTKLLKRSPNH